ncbi:hypothetical protein [Novispirillum itersonii]|nr:hypothetical protein [Novispirillum itersonii]
MKKSITVWIVVAFLAYSLIVVPAFAAFGIVLPVVGIGELVNIISLL